MYGYVWMYVVRVYIIDIWHSLDLGVLGFRGFWM